MAKRPALRAPFPYFGGKSRVAEEVWRRFGAAECSSYVEPFFGSGAVLFARPIAPKVYSETVCDLSGNLTNFWRSVQRAPEEVARWCMVPIDHLELQARKRWQLDNTERVRELAESVEYYDARAAGYWLYGMCGSIGDGWGCDRVAGGIPSIGDYGRGLFGGAAQPSGEWLSQLAARLERTRIVCGDWRRVCGPSVTDISRARTPCGIFLDPPYLEGSQQYEAGGTGSGLFHDVAAWAVQRAQEQPWCRIALCGYDGHWQAPEGWAAHPWKARGGFGNTGNGAGRANASREVVWFSPACLA